MKVNGAKVVHLPLVVKDGKLGLEFGGELKLFRDGHIAEIEHGIASAFWTELKARLTAPKGTS